MKRIAAVFLLLGTLSTALSLSARAKPQGDGVADYERQSKLAFKKQQKQAKKAAKKQYKAIQKAQKKQAKAWKKAQKEQKKHELKL